MDSSRNIDFIALGGMPRSGSTLLSSILSENPKIHAENHSAVCQLMWDLEVSFSTDYCRDSISGMSRRSTQFDIINSIHKTYYNNSERPIVIDKCRSWPHKENLRMIKQYIRADPKIIVTTRNLDDIINSFKNIYLKNNMYLDEKKLLEPDTYPITKILEIVEWAKSNNNGEYFFVDYDNLVKNPKKTIDQIYSFCGWEQFDHNFNNIVDRFPVNDSTWGVNGLHSVKSTI